MLPILLPARAFGSIFSGYGYGFRFSGCRGAARVRQAGRFTRHSFRVNLPCQPAPLATLAVAPLSPSTYRLIACALQVSTLPEPLPPDICYAIDTAAIDGNHGQQSTTRRHCLCGTAAKWRAKAVAVGIVGSKWVIVACSSWFDFSSGHGKPLPLEKTTHDFAVSDG